MLAKLLAALRSKKGFFGALVLFGYTAYGTVVVLGNAATVADNLDGALRFLATGPGVLVAVSGAVLLILWAVLTQQPETEPSPQPASAVDLAAIKENERLKREARAVAQERDKYRTMLTDPDAVRQREEERLLRLCREGAVQAHGFASAHSGRWTDELEAVERFRRRHYAAVEESREELDKRGWLTDQERDDLTLKADDGLDKIKRMASVLGNISTKH